MKLSVLIPMYNAEKYIGNCLDSLIQQDLNDNEYEIIVMDDGSTDNSTNIVTEYVKNNNNIIFHKEKNVGAYSTRNKLLKLAKGEFIYNLDADDYIVHNCFGGLLKLAKQNDMDIIGFDTTEIYAKTPEQPKEVIIKEGFPITSGITFIETHRYLRHEIWWYFIKRGFLKGLNMVFNENEYNADVNFTVSVLLKAKKVLYLPVSIHRYVQTNNSIMRSDDLNKVIKRIEYMQMTIINKSKLINTLNASNNKLIDNLTHRRDVFVFFNVLKMIKIQFSIRKIKDEITVLKLVNAYPINNFIDIKYRSILYKFLVFIINKESLLFAIVSLRNNVLKFFK